MPVDPRANWMKPAIPDVDFLIITALEEELRAVLTLLPGHHRMESDGPLTYYEAVVPSSDSGHTDSESW